MNKKQYEKYLFYIFISSVFIAVAGLLKIIHIPGIPSIFYQSFLVFSGATILGKTAEYLMNENEGEKEIEKFQSKQRQKTQELTRLLQSQNLSSDAVLHHVKSLPKFSGNITSRKPLSNNLKEQDINPILILFVLHVIKMQPIKFSGKKTVRPIQGDAEFFLEETTIANIISKAVSYLRYALYSPDFFGNDLSYEKFLSQLLKDNENFLGNLDIPNLKQNLQKALSAFDRDLNRPIKDLTKLTKKPAPTRQESFLTVSTENQSPKTEKISPPSPTLSNYSSEVNSSKTQTSADLINIDDALESCSVQSDCFLEHDGKKSQLKINLNKLPQFAKIIKTKIEQNSYVEEDGYLIIFLKTRKLDEIASALIREYQTTSEFEQRKDGSKLQKLRRVLELTDKPWQENERETIKSYLKNWQDATLQNHQQFADFLNEANYLKKFAESGSIYLKGSYLYGNLMGLTNAPANDIDLEIHIPNLFSEDQTQNNIKKIIEDNLGFKITDEQIKIDTKNSYIHLNLEIDGKKIDLSFYDKNKLPKYDWIYNIDALRLNLNDALKSDAAITADKLLPLKPSLSNGFLSYSLYGSADAEKVLKIIQSGNILVNTNARDLLFNTVKRISKGILTIEQAQSLYKNDENFKKKIDAEWDSTIQKLEMLSEKCKKSEIDINDFHKIREEIMRNNERKSPTKATAAKLRNAQATELETLT